MGTYRKGGYTVRNHRELKTRDGYAMTGTICYEGKPVGTYEDGGYGGPMEVHFPKLGDAAGFQGHLHRAHHSGAAINGSSLSSRENCLGTPVASQPEIAQLSLRSAEG
jgi:hypothetical protein